MNINSLPSPLLQRILSSLPLATLLRLHHVCSAWAGLQRSILASVTELTILLGNSEGHDMGKKFYHFHIPHLEELESPTVPATDSPLSYIKNRNKKFELCFEWLDRFFAEQIARQLPNVTSLLISVHSLRSPTKVVGERSLNQKDHFIDSLAILFSGWSAQLTRLTFIASAFYYLPSVYYELMPRLISSINLCKALKHLSLETASGYESGRTRPSSLGDFAVLGWLETLTFDAGELGREAVEGALKYGAGNAHLQAISFSYYKKELFENLINEENLTEESRKVLSKFRQFGFLDLKEVGTKNWRQFLSTFTGLQRLRISVEKDGFSQLEEMLWYLGEKNGDSLLYLDLVNWNFRREDGAVECFEEARNRDRRKGNYLAAATTPITSVRILRVNSDNWKGGEVLHFLPWAALFPNLEVLNFTYDSLCSVCYPKNDEDEEKVAKMLPSLKVTIDTHWTSNFESEKGRKLRQILFLWAGCLKLRVVHFSSAVDRNDW